MKKRNRIWVVLLILIVILMAAFFSLYFLIKSKKLLLNPYLVSANAVTGVDLSSYQGDVEMDLLAAQGIEFVYIKATEGSSHVDQNFAANWENAKASPLAAGAYHFFSFDSGGRTQAENYIRTVGDLSGSLVPVIDVEYYGGNEQDPPAREDVIRELQVMLDALEEEYGVKPMVYSSKRIYQTYLKGEIDGYPLWVRSVNYPAWMDGWFGWTVWQYCDRGELDGYSGGIRYIDLNVLHGGKTLEELMVP